MNRRNQVRLGSGIVSLLGCGMAIAAPLVGNATHPSAASTTTAWLPSYVCDGDFVPIPRGCPPADRELRCLVVDTVPVPVLQFEPCEAYDSPAAQPPVPAPPACPGKDD